MYDEKITGNFPAHYCTLQYSCTIVIVFDLKSFCKKRIPVFLNESSTSYNNSQASKGKADDAIAHPQKTRSGKDRLKSINRITHWFWAMPGCNRRQCIYVEKAQSACPWARPLLRDVYHLLS